MDYKKFENLEWGPLAQRGSPLATVLIGKWNTDESPPIRHFAVTVSWDCGATRKLISVHDTRDIQF
jgi:hypothetical protein